MPLISASVLEWELRNHPDRQFVNYLVQGITSGFDTGINELPSKNYICKNNLSAVRNSTITTELVHKELTKGYLLGPFPEIPYERYRINPISLAQKKYSGKVRLVVDMSAPHENPDIPSINDLISKEDFKLSYVKMDEAIQIIQRLGRGALLCKTDLVDAFKTLPVKEALWPYQGIFWQGNYYFYTRLVFGCRSSCKIFDTLSRAIAWIAENNYNIQHILHLLDDFLTIDPPKYDAIRTMALLTLITNRLRVERSLPKTVGPSTDLEYLGIIVDTFAMECRLPQDKLQRLIAMIRDFLGKSKCTQQSLLSLLGHLAFAARVIPPGRTFMSRLFRAAYSVKRLHHRVSLNSEAKADLVMWNYFLKDWNGISLFIDQNVTDADDFDLYSDASGTVGFGAYFQKQWFYGAWPQQLEANLDSSVSICYKELYPIVIAAMLWGKFWARKRILFHCDNQGTVYILNKGSSKSPDIMKLMRRLTLVAARFSFTFSACYIASRDNSIADALSRFQIDKFRLLAPQADEQPCQIPSQIIFN